MRTPLVREGQDVFLPYRLDDPPHTLLPVYREMLLQICADYSSLPNALELDQLQIRSFYEGSRAGLKKTTKPQPKKP